MDDISTYILLGFALVLLLVVPSIVKCCCIKSIEGKDNKYTQI